MTLLNGYNIGEDGRSDVVCKCLKQRLVDVHLVQPSTLLAQVSGLEFMKPALGSRLFI